MLIERNVKRTFKYTLHLHKNKFVTVSSSMSEHFSVFDYLQRKWPFIQPVSRFEETINKYITAKRSEDAELNDSLVCGSYLHWRSKIHLFRCLSLRFWRGPICLKGAMQRNPKTKPNAIRKINRLKITTVFFFSHNNVSLY